MSSRLQANPLEQRDNACPPPIIDEVKRLVLASERALRRRHVEHLWVIGSVARGDAVAASDIDIVVEIDAAAEVSLTAFSSLRLDLIDLLGRKVDLAEWRNLRSSVAQSARHGAVQVF